MNGTREPAADLRLYLLFAVAVLASRLLASRLLLVYDDAFITFTYARNLAEGAGFVYYPGEPILGTTAPLFGLLSSLFYLFRLPMPASAVAVNALLDVGVMLLTIASVRRDRRVLTGAVFAALFAISPIVTRVSVGAMETSLYLFAALSAMLLFRRGSKGVAFGIASLMYFLRPEALLLLALLGVEQIRTRRNAETVRLAALSVACIAVPLAAMYLVYGHVLPQSVMAKSGTGSSLGTVLKRFLAPDPLQASLLLPAAWGIVVALRERWNAGRLVMVWCGLYLVAYAVARPHVWSWYGVPVYYGVVLLASVGVVDVLARIRLSRLTMRLSPVLVLAPIVVWLVAFARLGPTPGRKVVRDRIEAWCRENVPDTATTIAAADIGVIGYYSRARIYDLNGLVWPRYRDYGSWHQAIKAVGPDYLFLNTDRSTVDIMHDPDISSRYVPVARFSTRPDAPLELTDSDVAGGWRPEYIVYRRVEPPAGNRP